MTDVIKKSLTDLRAALEKSLGDNLLEVRLFGSRARGDAEPDSDVDVLVIIKERTLELDDNIIEVASDLSLRYSLVIVPFVWTVEKLERHRDLNTLLYRNIMSEGIRV